MDARGSTTAFADATNISSNLDPTGLGAPQTYAEADPGPGDWYYWAVAYTAEGVHNDPGAPVLAVDGGDPDEIIYDGNDP